MSTELLVIDEKPRPDQCETCRFWLQDTDPEDMIGDCRRYPPLGPNDGGCASFPRSFGDDWCGEWRPKDAATPELRESPISLLGLSNRAMHCLEAHRGPRQFAAHNDLPERISTIGDLMRFTPKCLLKVHNLGRGTLHEIQEALARHGLKLAGDESPLIA